MGHYSVYDLRDNVKDDKRKKSGVVISNIDVDFRNLSRLSELKVPNEGMNLDVYDFESTVRKFNDYIKNHSIPCDQIQVTGNPGIVITSQKHREILEDFLKNNYLKNKYSTSVPNIGWSATDSLHYISNITINDVLYDYVPLNFTFEPFINVTDKDTNDTKLCSSYKFLGLTSHDNIKFECVVLFNDFMKELNRDGYYLLFDGYEVTTYEEYFNRFLKIFYSNELSINIDLYGDNNIRR